ncbi:MAG: hypothetical protein HY590_02225 [Candidatus Omnitrophica bacterium]|nr:hypothetical protein [Candidatus Omnitrophota bacterium]
MRLPTIVIRSDILESWLTVSDYSKSRLASELGISKGRISQLLTSREEPSAHLIAKLMTLTFLPFDRLFVIVRDNPSRVALSRPSHRTPKTSNGRRNRSALGRSRGLSTLKGVQ